MKGSILYLAIVAIWAGFLVPAWLRRPHSSRADEDAQVAGHTADDEEYAEFSAEFTAYPDDPEHDGADFEADIHVEVGHHHHAGGSVGGRGREYRDDGLEYAEAGSGAGSAYGSEAGWRPAGPSQSREQMLRARRRMLTILVALTGITAGFAGLGLVHWWICVPPAAMLVLYVLLLREIALADAELASKRAAWEAHAMREQQRAAQAEHEALARQAAEPTAQIIDISGRVGDQLYDQYADAAVRAVGD